MRPLSRWVAISAWDSICREVHLEFVLLYILNGIRDERPLKMEIVVALFEAWPSVFAKIPAALAGNPRQPPRQQAAPRPHIRSHRNLAASSLQQSLIIFAMAPPTEPLLTELEEAMRHAFFLPSLPTEMEETADDPPVSIPNVELIWEDEMKRIEKIIEGPLMREIANKYPSLFSASRIYKGVGEDLWRNPEKAENLFSTQITSQNLAKIKFLQDFFKAIEQTDQVQQSDENLELLEEIKHSLENMQVSLSYIQHEISSTIPLLKAFAYVNEIPQAFDPSLDPSERLKRGAAMFNNMKGLLQEMKLNISGVPPAQNLFDVRSFLNLAESSGDFMQQVPALTQDSRLPNLSVLEDYRYQKLPTETSIRLLRFEQQDGQDDQPNLI
jgi:hypothetical protein